MKLGLVGLPNVGKSTLFNALSKSKAEAANYPFCTIEPNVAIVEVKDERLTELEKIYNPKKVTPAILEFVDIAGLVEGASRGEGLGNKFLDNIKKVDAIIHIVRCFKDENITHVYDDINPIRDLEVINMELILKDIEVVSKRVDKLKKQLKGDKSLAVEVEFLEKLKDHLYEEKAVRDFEISKDEEEFLKPLELLTVKPIIYAANFLDSDFEKSIEQNEYYKQMKEYVVEENAILFPVCAKMEEELNELDNEDKELFLSEYSLDGSGLDRIIKTSYSLLGLISYLTAGADEVRAWTIKQGTKAPQAAGKIHSDFEKGFISAEVINYDDFIKLKSMTQAKEKGLVRIEGKNYIVKDGDIVLFRFNV